MRRLLFTVLIFAPVLSFAALAGFKVYKYTYPCGTKLLVYEDTSKKLVSIQAWVDVGSRDERKGEEGIAHLLEHMMFRGAEKGKGYIAKKVEALGGYINAYTSYDHTVYHLYLNSDNWKEGVKILAERIFNASFKKDEFEAEKRVVLEEIRMNNDDPSRAFHKWAFSTLYPKGHPYSHPVIGFEKTVESFTLSDLERFYKREYKPWKITFVVCGNVGFAEVKNYLENFVPKLPGKSLKKTHAYSLEGFKRGVHEFVRKDAKLARIVVAFPIPGVLSDDMPYLDLLSSYLSSGRTSPLVKKLREEKRIFRSIYSYAFTPYLEGFFIVEGAIKQEKLEEGLEELLNTIYSVSFNEKRLERAKKAALSDLLFSLESLGSVARYLGFFEVDGGGWNRIENYVSSIKNASLEDLEAVFSRYLRPESACVFILSQRNLDLSALEKKLLRWSTGKVEVLVLDNGVKVIMRKRVETPTFSIVASMKGGTVFETKANNGIFNAISRMLTRGCGGMDALEFSGSLQDIGGSISGFSGRNSFGLKGRFLTESQDKALELFMCALTTPNFRKDELEKVKKDMLEDVKREKENPIGYSIKKAFRVFYGDRGYGLSTTGSKDSIKALNVKALEETYKRFLSPKNIVISVVGNFDQESLVKTLRQHLSSLSGEEVAYPRIKPKKPRKLHEKARLMQDNIVVMFKAPPIDSKDHHTFELFEGILGGQGGLLFTELRDKRSLCYAVFPFYFPGKGSGLFGIYIGTSKEKKEKALSSLLETLENLSIEKVTDLMKRSKEYVKGGFERGLETNMGEAFQMALYETLGLGWEEMERFQSKIDKITPKELVESYKRFKAKGLYYFIYGP